MTILRIGSTQKYADNWERAFGGKGNKKSLAGTPSAATTRNAKVATKTKATTKATKSASAGKKKASAGKKRTR